VCVCACLCVFVRVCVRACVSQTTNQFWTIRTAPVVRRLHRSPLWSVRRLHPSPLRSVHRLHPSPLRTVRTALTVGRWCAAATECTCYLIVWRDDRFRNYKAAPRSSILSTPEKKRKPRANTLRGPSSSVFRITKCPRPGHKVVSQWMIGQITCKYLPLRWMRIFPNGVQIVNTQ